MIFAKEISICFVLLCALVGSTSATPIPRPSSAGPLWVVPNDSKKIGFDEVHIRLLLGTVGHHELMSIVNGSHYIVPLHENIDQERKYKTVAIAVSKLYMNLKSMERAEKFMSNVAEELISKTEQHEHHYQNISDTASLEGLLKTFFNSYIENMNKKFESDDELAEEYKKQKSIAKQFVERNPGTPEPFFKVKDEYPEVLSYGPNSKKLKAFIQGNGIFCDGMVNQEFIMSARNHRATFNSTDYERKLLAKALIQKAQSSGYESKVNEVYHKALVQVRPFAGATYVNQYTIQNALFDSIDQELASDATLQKEIEVLVKEMEDKKSGR